MEGDDYGERAEREPLLGARPPVGSRGFAPGGSQGAKPPGAVDIFIYRSMNFCLEIDDFTK